MNYDLRLYKDDIAPGAMVVWPAGSDVRRAIYVVSGALRFACDACTGALGANSAFVAASSTQIAGGSLATVALRWELTAAGAPPATRAGSGISSNELLSASLRLEPGREYQLRCDRVDFPPGGEALLHTHQGGGIRCVLFGGIEIQTQRKRHEYAPLDAWFEAGPDPVYAAASRSEATAFARVMVLPRALLGKSSIAYVNAADFAKPKNQRYQVFVDALIELPG